MLHCSNAKLLKISNAVVITMFINRIVQDVHFIKYEISTVIGFFFKTHVMSLAWTIQNNNTFGTTIGIRDPKKTHKLFTEACDKQISIVLGLLRQGIKISCFMYY